MMPEHSTDESKVAVHWCYTIGYIKHADGSANSYKVTVRRPTITERGTKFINTCWDAAYLFAPGKSPGPCFEEAS